MQKDVIQPKSWVLGACILPGIAWYVYVVILPMITAMRNSLYNWSGGPKMTYIGFKNYQFLMRDSIFWQAFRNNLTITLLSLIGQIGFAFILSSLLAMRFVRLKRLHRTVAYFPSTVSAVVVGYVWSVIFNYDSGLLNSLLRAVGLESWASPWLDIPSSIMYVVSIPIIWQYIGYYMIIILAGISSIDQEVYDMAEIDGANGVQRALKITLPLIKGTLGVCVMLCISGNMRIFDHIYSLTGGGPGNSSIVMAMHAYKTTFIKSQFGYASAMSFGIMVLSLSLIMFSRVLIQQPWRKEAAIDA
ncbi:MAG: sugar ABC transporter permease [Clostridiales bacterium]|nr:sugar ABC transporter permease [Clostridiales bacterium]